MIDPLRQEVASEVRNEISLVLLNLGHFLCADDPRVLEWSDRLEKALTGRGRVDAFVGLAAVAHLQGDIELAERFFTRAEGAGLNAGSLAEHRCAAYHALGYFSKGLPYLREAYSIGVQNVVMGLSIAAGMGAFRFVWELLEQAQRAKLKVDSIDDIQEIRQFADVANELDIQDERIACVLDIAGVLLRERHLLWMGRAPSFSYDKEMNWAALHFIVDVSASEATEMNFDFIRRLVAADLDSVPMTVGFIGNKFYESTEAV